MLNYNLITAVVTSVCHSSASRHKKRGKHRRGSRYPRDKRYDPIRTRVSSEQSYERLGPAGFRRAYRMTYESFCKLHELLEEGIKRNIRRLRPSTATGNDTRNRSNMKPPPVPNGPITTSMRLLVALRFFKGCPSFDIHELFGMSHAAVTQSIWIVVQAINDFAPFHLEYPSDHNQQQAIAESFRQVSTVDFANCAGAIDGILIWIHRPTVQQAQEAEVGQQKFYCGRKGKYGLNCQAVADVNGRFLDLSINYGGSTSDVLAFEASKLCDRLEKGLLAPGLNLFGDNAYLNTCFMATPFPNVSKGPKDDYNFFQSQLRIRVECAFGMLVQRWAILRSIIPAGITIGRTVALVVALAKLHNFCIDEREEMSKDDLMEDDDPDVIRTSERRGRKRKTIDLAALHEKEQMVNTPIPAALLDGGEHFLDHARNTRRQDDNRVRVRDGSLLPRESMLDVVIKSGKHRPKLLRDGQLVFDP
jgi:DDE superfamily endonuclease